PEVDNSRCNGCRRCVDLCQFNAIAVLGQRVLLFSDLCHGCGGCVNICPTGALSEKPYPIGETGTGQCRELTLDSGSLAIGQSMAPPLIRAVKTHADGKRDYIIIDCPPGTACPMVSAVRGADFTVLVTEPTPFGLHDLALAVATLRELQLPFGVVINRADSGDDRVREYCRKENIPILLEIPQSRTIAAAYSRGQTLLQAAPELRPRLQQLLDETARLAATEVTR
ncbi:MAG: ATP-binding protein, partial [Victivallales bacterium]|nr:ATP-binding protein [Victivallales bacterium]